MQIITSEIKNQFYCQKCKISHNSLYIDKNNNKYCPNCVPKELKKKEQ